MRNRLLHSALSCAALLLASAACAQEAATLPPDLPINELQVLGTHNSYALPADPRLIAYAEKLMNGSMGDMGKRLPPAARALFQEEHPNDVTLTEALNYRPLPLPQQLAHGLRSLEIDVNPDPEGGHFRDPAGYRYLRAQGATNLLPFDSTDMDRPGFKVMHVADLDFRSHCNTLVKCLTQVKIWSDAHPKHVPLFLLIEAKSQAIPMFPGATTQPPFDAAAFDALDREFLSVFPRDRIITPDDVRGTYPTLRDAVLAHHWPKLSDARGKVMFLILTAHGKSGTEAYITGHPSLRGRMAFLRSDPGDEYGAFLLVDNAIVRKDEIAANVKAGYLVRVRSDIETYEAKVNDLTRATTAFATGAQIVSTDFPVPGNGYGTSYVVRLPGDGVARVSPAFTGH